MKFSYGGKMKILLCTMKMDIGGAETHILELSKELCARGHDVTVASGGGRLVAELERVGAEHISVPLYSKNPLLLVAARNKLSSLIARERFDIVHAHARIPAFICGDLQRKYGFRFVTTAHYDFRVTPLLRRMTDWGEYCFAVSPDIKEYVIKNYGFPKKNITVVPNGIDTDVFSPSAPSGKIYGEFPELKDKRIILHVSRLETYSSLCAKSLIKAMERIGADFPDSALVIVGGGRDFDFVSELAERTNSKLGREAVFALGARTDVRDLIADSYMFAGPSRAALEAMACGKPTVVSGSQGHIGIFSKETVVLCEKTNFCGRDMGIPTSEKLCRDISALLSAGSEEYASLGNYCREYVCEHYSVEIMTDIYEREYERLSRIVTGKHHDYMLCGYYGFGNLGDEALEECIISSVRERKPSADICVMTHTPKKTSRRFSVGAVHRMNIFAVSKALKNTDTFIFGGGNLLQDKTSSQSLVYYTKMLDMAKKRGCRTVIFANGLGPFEKASGLRLAAKAAAEADEVSMRETYSLELFRELCPISDPTLGFDPAITVVPDMSAKRDGRYFVVAPKFFSRSAEREFTEAVKNISHTFGLKAYVLPMYEKEDLNVCRRIASSCDGEVMDSGISPQEAAGLISGAELLLGSRLHSLIFATVGACPMIAVSDDIKLFSYVDMIGAKTDGGRLCYLPEDSGAEEIARLAAETISSSSNIRLRLSNGLDGWKKTYIKSLDILR